MTGKRANFDHFVILLRPRGLLLDLGDWLPQLLCCLLLHGGASSYFFKILPLIVLLDFYFDIFTWFLHILISLLDFYFQDFLFGAIKLEFAWILAREKNLDPEMVRMVFEVDHGLWFWSEDDCFEKMTIPSWSTRPMCWWRTASTSPPWRTPSRMRTACTSETFDNSLFFRSALLWYQVSCE